ncbi:MAG: carbohydrate binding domain-containing protein [Frankiaceae bacterium]
MAASPGIALAVTSSTASTTSNLVKNPGFESGTTAWHTNGSAQRLTTVSPGRSGSYAAKLTVTAQSDAVLNDATNSVASTAAGSSYRAQAYVRTATPGVNGRLRLREVSGGTMVGRGYTAFSLSDTAWHLVTLTYAPVRAGSSLDLNVYALGLTTSKQLQVDDVSLMPTTATTTTTPSPNLSATATTSSTTCSVSAILVPSCGAWFGVGVNPLHGESYDQALTNFESLTGRTAAIVHYYHSASSLFPSSSEIARARQTGHRRLLLINWRPAGSHTWAQVANGAVDAQIDKEAAYVKSHFTERFFLSLEAEPENNISTTAGSGRTAADYRNMFRHVVLRLRADGARNIITVMDYIGLPTWGTKSWFSALYPGNDVVDWLAEDPYIIGPKGSWYDNDYDSFVNRTFPGYSYPGFYTWAGNIAPGKPIMIAEWGVGELSDTTWKAGKFKNIAAHLADMPRVKAFVYWNSNYHAPVGTTRVDSSSASLSAYKALAHLAATNPVVPSS